MTQRKVWPDHHTRATIYDVARYAGVAISTVSRVLNDAEDVSQETRSRVLKVVEELQYTPHRTARTLAKKKMSSLAVAVPTFTMPTFTQLLKGVQEHLRQHDIDLLLCDLGSTKRRANLQHFIDRGAVDGLLLAGMNVDESVSHELESLGTHIVLVGSESEIFDCFHWDHEAGARLAVGHFIKQGHKRVGMIVTHEGTFGNAVRFNGYRSTLEEAGLPFDDALVKRGITTKHRGNSEEAGYEAMEMLLEEKPRVTAIFTSSDVLAIGAWKAAEDHRIRIPGDLALIGYDDIKVSRYIGLATIDLEIQKVGREATELLIKRMKQLYTGPEVSIRMVPKLVLRKSSTTM